MEKWTAALRAFLDASRFHEGGAIVTDLDGTAVHEHRGRVVIPHGVSHALRRLYRQGHPVIVNSLRFPLNIIETFGREWEAITGAALPIVSLNGSIIGHLTHREGATAFEEVSAYPLAVGDIAIAARGIDELIRAGITELLVFYYPRNWRKGEQVWSPGPEIVEHARHKFPSAMRVFSAPFETLLERLSAEEVCMMFILIDRPGDQLMAYQHSQPANFITRAGVDKLSGCQRLAEALGIDLAGSIGAGDTLMDTFLSGVGLAVHVGPTALPYRGRLGTLRVADSAEFGAFLDHLGHARGGITDT